MRCFSSRTIGVGACGRGTRACSAFAEPQASAKWRLLWRLAPRLLDRWDAQGRLTALNTAVSDATKKVGTAHSRSSLRATSAPVLLPAHSTIHTSPA